MSQVNYNKQMLEQAPKDFYIYSAQFTTVNANTSQVQTIQTDVDSVFQIQALTWSAVNTTGTSLYFVDVGMGQQFPGITVTIFDNTTGLYLTDKAVPVDNLFGCATYPGIIPGGYMVGKYAALTITLYNNYSAMNLGYAWLSFVGRKFYV